MSNPSQILVIDDEEMILTILRLALEPEGFVVHAFTDPAAALKWYALHVNAVDLVITDYMMPALTGDEVFEYLQQLNPGVRVLLLTAYDEHVARAMFARGLRGYIQKPFRVDDLISRVREELAVS